MTPSTAFRVGFNTASLDNAERERIARLRRELDEDKQRKKKKPKKKPKKKKKKKGRR